jgi:hypothetical protein
VFDALGVEQVGDAHAEHVLRAEEKSIREGPVETKDWETFADRGHDVVTLLRGEAGSRKRVCQFVEKHRVEAKPGHSMVASAETGMVGPLSGDIPKELELGILVRAERVGPQHPEQ